MNNPQFTAFLALALLPTTAQAQWSTSAANNLAVDDAAAGQSRGKVVATPDGGSYVSWYDWFGTGYDLRLQKLDVGGNKLWPQGGITIDRSYNTAPEYGLAVDSAGSALLTYLDDHLAGSDEIVASRVSPLGQFLWTSSGILLSTGNSSFTPSTPRIAATADGGSVTAWAQAGAVKIIGLDAAGSLKWTHLLTSTQPDSYTAVTDLIVDGNNTLISLLRQSSFASGLRSLDAYKVDGAGIPLWSTPTVVFDAGSLQVDPPPAFKSDGNGGAWFAFASSTLGQCFVQHVLSDGTEAFAHSGLPVSSNSTRRRQSPAMDVRLPSGVAYVFWEEQNGTQTQFGMSGQRFDATGLPQWGPEGIVFVSLSSSKLQELQTLATDGGAVSYWREGPNSASEVIRAQRVESGGITDIGPLDVASVPSPKSQLSATLGITGHTVLTWTDARSDAGDILAQNLNIDGTLGGLFLGNPVCFGTACPCGNNDAMAGCLNSTGKGANIMALGSTSVAADNLIIVAENLRPNAPAILFAGSGQIQGGAGTFFGDGLLCVRGPIQRFTPKFADASGHEAWGPGLIGTGNWVAPGNVRYLQVWYRDPRGGACGGVFNTSHAIELGFGQ